MRKITVTVLEGNEAEEYKCPCGNSMYENGFVPCDSKGNEVEPDVGSNWNGLYMCVDCGRIIMEED